MHVSQILRSSLFPFCCFLYCAYVRHTCVFTTQSFIHSFMFCMLIQIYFIFVCDTPSMHILRTTVSCLLFNDFIHHTIKKKKNSPNTFVACWISVHSCSFLYLCVWNRCSMNDRDSFFLLFCEVYGGKDDTMLKSGEVVVKSYVLLCLVCASTGCDKG